MILRNAAKCRKCGEVVESKHRHDFVSCKCGAIFVDGGKEYLRRGGNPEDIEEMNETTAPTPIAKSMSQVRRIEAQSPDNGATLALRLANENLEEARRLVDLVRLHCDHPDLVLEDSDRALALLDAVREQIKRIQEGK